MKKKMMIKGILAASLAVISCLNSVTIKAENNYDDTEYWSSRCTLASIADASDYSACEAYRTYMAGQSEELSAKFAEIEAERETISANLQEYADKLSEYQSEVDALNSEISALSSQISDNQSAVDTMTADMEKTQQEIDEQQEEVDEIAGKVLDRMVSAQWTMRLNTYFEIIVGAKTFKDLIRIVNGLSDITAYEQSTNAQLVESMELLNAAKEKLEEEKQKLEEASAELEKELADLEEKRNDVLVAQYKAQVIEEEFEKQAASAEAEGNKYADDLSTIMSMIADLGDALDNIPDTVINPTPEPTPEAVSTPEPETEDEEEDTTESTPAPTPTPTPTPTPVPTSTPAPSITTSTGWTYPVPGAYRSAGTWYYPGGSAHLGYDFAASLGSTIYAVGNGIILFSSDNCSTYGYLGSSCGYPGSTGGGNQAYLLTKINGYLYAVKYLHMMSGTVISKGTIVSAGDVIGKVGTSGNSSGPHCHIEIFYLGSADNFSSYARNWNGDLAFGAGWAGSDRKCDAGYSAPCRIRPESIFGY